MVDCSGEEREENARPNLQRLMGWLWITVPLLLQYGLFRQHAQRELVWAYPGLADQSAYRFVLVPAPFSRYFATWFFWVANNIRQIVGGMDWELFKRPMPVTMPIT
jgi:hypothetical protein